MKRYLPFQFLFLLICCGLTLPLCAQVKGISYTISPTANYTFWDKEAGLSDGILVGGRLGLGFGELIELRANYLVDLGLKNDFGDFGLTQNIDNLAERDVKLTRYGGEIKMNLSRGNLLPFLTLGTGIQELELDGGLSNEHIYASGGLGIILRVADRFNFTLEGKNTSYNFNSVRNLLTEDDRNGIGADEDDFGSERLSNWSVGAGLSLYLGGRRPGQLSAVDEAYQRAFEGGFRGASILIEPSISNINFDENLPYRDTWLGGAAVGLNFGPLVGFRAYYLQAMEDNNLNLDFDKLAMYGGDFRFRLSNRQTGLAPFIILGGGYINAGDDYIGRDGMENPISQAFAAGGGGIALNLGRSLRIVGSYKALLTTGREVEDLNSTDEIRTSGQWSAGVNLSFGAKYKRPEAVFASEADARLERQRAEDAREAQAALNEQARRNAESTKQLQADYETKLTNLREELDVAYRVQDSIAIDSLEQTVAEAETVVAELAERSDEIDRQLDRAVADSLNLTTDAQVVRRENAAPASAATAPAAPPAPQGSRLVFTPAEFEGLIEEIFEGLNYGMPTGGYPPTYRDEEFSFDREEGMITSRTMTQDSGKMNAMERRLDELQATVKELADRQAASEVSQDADKAELRQEMRESTRQILEELQKMRSEMMPQPEPTRRELRQQEREERRQNGNG